MDTRIHKLTTQSELGGVRQPFDMARSRTSKSKLKYQPLLLLQYTPANTFVPLRMGLLKCFALDLFNPTIAWSSDY